MAKITYFKNLKQNFGNRSYTEVQKCFSVNTVQKVKISINDFFSKCYQIRSCLGIWSHLFKKSLMQNFNFFYSLSFITSPNLNMF